MAPNDLEALVLLNEIMGSDDEKSRRGKTRSWIKRREEKGYFNNIIKELKVEDRLGFREVLRMDITDFEFILTNILNRISPRERLGGTNTVNADERLALTLRFLATSEAFGSLSFQFRISSLSAVSYIIEGCCKVITERNSSKSLLPKRNC